MAAAPQRGPRPHRSWLQRFGLTFGALGTVVVILAAGVVGYVNWRNSQLKRVDVKLSPIATGGPFNILIAGSDTRAGITRSSANAGAFLNGPSSKGTGLSDSIMVLRVDPASTQARILSIPRDLWVPIAGHTYSAKINSAFDTGDPQTLIDTVEQDLHIPISHYVDVDFVGFQRLVDAVGGVPVYFDVPMRDSYTGLDVDHTGCVVLHGEQALAFARSRHLQYKVDGRWHSDGANDYGRQVRQQFLIRKTIQKVHSDGIVTHPAELNAVIDALVHSVTVDGSFSISDLVSLARRFESFDADALQSYELPASEYFVHGQDALKLDAAKAAPILAAFGASGSDSSTTAPEQVSVRVLNGSGVTGQATNVGGALAQVGFRLVAVGNGSEIGVPEVARTEVLYAPGERAAALTVASHVSGDVEVKQSSAVSDGEVVLLTGRDFTTVTATATSTAADGTSSPTTSPASSPTTPPATSAPRGAGAATTTTTTTVPGYELPPMARLARVPPENPPSGVSC